jgi:hypothetical protein
MYIKGTEDGIFLQVGGCMTQRTDAVMMTCHQGRDTEIARKLFVEA